MSDEKPMSMAERLKAKKAAAQQAAEEQPMSMAERLKAKKAALEAEADEKTLSLAEKMKAKKAEAAEEEAPQSLAQQMRAKRAAGAAAGVSLAAKMRSQSDALSQKLQQAISDVDSTPLPEETALTVSAKIEELKNTFADLAGRVELDDLVRDFNELGNSIAALPEKVQSVRRRGYIYRAYLEDKVDVFAAQWDNINDELDDWVDDVGDDMDDELTAIRSLIGKLNIDDGVTIGHQALSGQLESLVDALKTQVETAEEHVRDMYDELEREVNKTDFQIRQINGFLDEAEEASFEFQPGETVYLVAKAEWTDGNNKPDGNIFLTAHRLVFEQKEKTGKRLGMFGGKQTQETLWEAPLNAIESVESEKKGMMGGKDMLNLAFGSGASYPRVTVELKGGVDSNDWATQVKKAMRGQIGNESTVEEDPELIQRLQNAPTECPTCGGTLPQLATGQTSITCDYCGTRIGI